MNQEHIHAYIDVSSLLPTTPDTEFEELIFLNRDNTLDYRMSGDTRRFFWFTDQTAFTRVQVYANPVLTANSGVEFSAIDVMLTTFPLSSRRNVDPVLIRSVLSVPPQRPLVCLPLPLPSVSAPRTTICERRGVRLPETWRRNKPKAAEVHPPVIPHLRTTATLPLPAAATRPYEWQDTYYRGMTTRTFLPLALFYTHENTWCPSCVYDPIRPYVYVGSHTGNIHRYNRDTRSFVDSLNTGTTTLSTAVVDPASRYAYFTANLVPSKIVKIDLESFQVISTLTLSVGMNYVQVTLMDPRGQYLYVCPYETTVARIVRIALSTFTQHAVLTLPGGIPYSSRKIVSGVIDPHGQYAYLGTAEYPASAVGKVIRVNLTTFAFDSMYGISPLIGQMEGVMGGFYYENRGIYSLAIDPHNRYLYIVIYGVYKPAGIEYITTFIHRWSLSQPFPIPGGPLPPTEEEYVSYDDPDVLAIYGHAVSAMAIAPSGRTGYVFAYRQPGKAYQIDLERMEIASTVELSAYEGWSSYGCLAMAPDGSYLYHSNTTSAGGLTPFSLSDNIGLSGPVNDPVQSGTEARSLLATQIDRIGQMSRPSSAPQRRGQRYALALSIRGRTTAEIQRAVYTLHVQLQALSR